ncbi:TPA: class II fructose-bisphosphatase [Escherichia coli]
MMSLAWPLFRVTEQAALAAWPQTGCGDKNKIDGLAVTAMRQALNDVAFRGRVVIGEGEIDHAPMLWIGEEVGKGDGPEVDIAVDPIEGTRMVAMGQSNALAVMAFAPRDSLLHAPDMYMKKLVVNRLAAGAIDLSLPLTENLRQVVEGDCTWPQYDRQKHDPVEDALHVTAPLVIVEGNWLLLDDEKWLELASFCDFSIFIHAPAQILRELLISRKIAGGLTRQVAEAFYARTDGPNVERVLMNSRQANLIVEMTEEGRYHFTS